MEFVDDIEPTDWTDWARNRTPRPVWLAELSLSDRSPDVPRRVGGVFVTPPRQVMALRAWPDALEGLHEKTPWVLFDVEKVVRMALHQSGLAFELLTSPRGWTDDAFPHRRIAASAFHSGLISYYADVAQPLLAGSDELWRWRSLLTGWLLATSGEVSHRIETLVDRAADEAIACLVDLRLPPPGVADRYLAEMTAAADTLGSRPPDYDWLDEFVHRIRMERA